MAVRGKLGHRLSARDPWSFECLEHQEAARQAAGDVQEITGAEGVCEQADHSQQDRRCHGQAGENVAGIFPAFRRLNPPCVRQGPGDCATRDGPKVA